MAAQLPFEEDGPERDGEPALRVDVDGYEGPLDLLLDLDQLGGILAGDGPGADLRAT